MARRRLRSPPTTTPPRTATCRSPRRRACACAGRARARPAHGRRGSDPAYREEVERRVELVGPQRKVACGDGWREPIVERLGQTQRFVDPVPAELDRPGMHRELAGVEQTEQLDLAEHRGAQLAELVGTVFAD